MSIRTATMSDPYSPSGRRPGFLLGLFLMVLFIAGMVAVMSLLDRYQTNLSWPLMTVFAVVSVGLAVGLASRAFFYQRPGYVRFLMVLLMLPLGLFALGFFTNWRMGVGPLEPWLAGVIDPVELVQLLGGLWIALLALQAWRRPVAKIEEAVYGSSRSSKRTGQARAKASVQLPRFKPPHFNLPHFHLPKSWTSRPNGYKPLKLSRRSKAASYSRMPDVERVIVPRPSKSVRSKRRKLNHRKPELQFSVYEEHRCPYCLEEVKRNDPRGVKECDVCHTLHHADCWDITGMCQVPHLNT